MGIKKRIISLSIPLVCSSLLSNNLENLERSSLKDFYIYEYLKSSNLEPQNVIDTLGLSFNVSNELFFEYAKKINHDETLAVAQCMYASATELVDTNSDCIVNGLSIKKAEKLNSLELATIIEKTKNEYPSFAKKIKILNSPLPFTKLISSDSEIIYDIYLNSSMDFKSKKLNYKLPKKTIEKLIDDEKFEELLRISLENRDLIYLQSTFFDIDDSNLNSNSSFYLALIRVLNGKIDDKTNRYLQNSYLKAQNIIDEDRVLFWKYLIENRNDYLKVLDFSNPNYYSLLASEILNKDFKFDKNKFITLDKDLNSCLGKNRVYFYGISYNLSNLNSDKIDQFKLGLSQIDFLKLKDLDILDSNYDEKLLLDSKENIFAFNKYFNYLEESYLLPIQMLYMYENKEDEFLNHNFYNSSNDKLEPYISIEVAKNRDFLISVLKDIKIYSNILKEDYNLNELLKNSMKPLETLDF